VYRSDTVTINYDTVLNTLNNAIFHRYPLDSTALNNRWANISFNVVRNNGLIAGMGKLGEQAYSAITLVGGQGYIYRNIIDSVGYNGIVHAADTGTIRNNSISNFCLIKNDGGGIYSATSSKRNTTIASNIIYNGSSAASSGSTTFLTVGIYLDNSSGYNFTVDSNTVYNMAGYGYGAFINGGEFINMRYNTFYNCDTAAIGMAGYQTGVSIKNNNFISLASTSSLLSKSNGGFELIGVVNKNYYSRTVKEDSIIFAIGARYYPYNLPGIRAVTSIEVSGKTTVLGITGTPALYVNSTNSNVDFILAEPYKDEKGTIYAGTITLLPYTSKILHAQRKLSFRAFQINSL